MNKTRVYNILDLCLWIINPFLIVLVIFDQKIVAGLFLQWLGKMHPLALHFPIVFGILIIVYFLFFQKFRFPKDTEKLLLAINALFASAVAIFGIFLAKQGAYEGEIFDLHKWGGISIAFFSWVLLFILNVNIVLKKLIAVLFLVVLIGATHKGAQLTHGVNALSFPEREILEDGKFIINDSTSTIFETAVLPILNQKCVSCHGPDKVKGDLRLDSRMHILRGGESGDILTAGLTGDPILTRLIHLPEDHDEHMPPEGKLQLTKNELSLLRNWIKKENNFDIFINELSPDDSLVVLVENYIAANRKVEIKTDLPGLDEFNTDYCTVNYLFYGTDEVEVNFFQGSFYNRETLKNLLKIKSQIVRLNMQNMPLEKEDLDIILQFENLQKINLNSTQLTINEIEAIKVLDNLSSVAICGIEFNETELDNFLADAKFGEINVWADNVNQMQLETLVAKYPDIEFTIGDNLEDKVMQINTPVIEQDSLIIKTFLEVKLKHLLNGVDIFYTNDGSEPDSLSIQYTKPIEVSENTVIKAKAYKKGWISSDIVQRTFYKSGLTPDSIYLTETPHPKYPGKGALTLIDLSLGETNISNGEWLAYKDYDMEFTIGFDNVQVLKSIEINALTAIGQHIFPLNSISVSGSNDRKQFIHIAKVDFKVAEKEAPRQAELFTCVLPENTVFKYYKVTVSNLKEMPSWHQAKGKPAWIFMDEVFLN
jgi:hypothetical protein